MLRAADIVRACSDDELRAAVQEVLDWQQHIKPFGPTMRVIAERIVQGASRTIDPFQAVITHVMREAAVRWITNRIQT